MKSLLTAFFVLSIASFVLAQDGDKNWFQVYGHVMTDMGYNANQIQPDWYDVVRPTKLPTIKNRIRNRWKRIFRSSPNPFRSKE